jgi:hypothetical protein
MALLYSESVMPDIAQSIVTFFFCSFFFQNFSKTQIAVQGGSLPQWPFVNIYTCAYVVQQTFCFVLLFFLNHVKG